MSDLFASINGHRVAKLVLSVPSRGPWFADVDLDELVPLTGRVTIRVANVAFVGTVASASSGSFGVASRVRIVAGAGGWGNLLPRKAYHNDALVKALTVATDAAREAGEQLGSFAPPADRVGADYVRKAGAASLALEGVLDGTPWWVDYAGATHAGARPATPAGTYELLDFDARSKLATLAVEDLTAVAIGSVLSTRLDAPETVRELEIHVAEGGFRLKAWCGAEGSSTLELMAALTRKLTGGKVFGKYRYRVVTMAGDGRVNLQAVSKAEGLPDILPASQAPGVAGCHAELTPGAEVLVEFVAGDPTDPIVTGFPGKGEPGFVPVSLSFGEGAAPVAHVGSAVSILLPPALFTGVIGTTPVTNYPVMPTGRYSGTVTTGSAKVRVGT